MKKFVPVVVVIFMWTGINAQYSILPGSNDKFIPDHNVVVSPVFRKVPAEAKLSSFRIPGERQIKIGRTLTVLGGAMLIGGISIYANADKTVTYSYYINSYNQLDSTAQIDPKAILGALMIVAGTGMTIPGVLLWKSGAKKNKQYMKEQQGLSLGMRGNAAVLTYRF